MAGWCCVADLVTHGAAAVLLKGGMGWRYTAVFVAGTLMPDVFSRVPAIALGWVHVHLIPLPVQAMTLWQPLHQPLGMLLMAYLLCHFFEARHRESIFWNLLGGMAFHLGLDLLQDHHGVGYQLAFPFSENVWELGLIGSEATVPIAVPLALIAFLVVRRHQAGGSSA